MDFIRLFADFGVPNEASEFIRISRGAQGTPKKAKTNEERAKVTAAGAEGDRQKYMTVGICRLFRFGVVLGRLWWMLGPFWDLFRYHF